MDIFHSKSAIYPFYILLNYVLWMNVMCLLISNISYIKTVLSTHHLFKVVLLPESHMIFINNLSCETIYTGLIVLLRIGLAFTGMLFGFVSFQ